MANPKYVAKCPFCPQTKGMGITKAGVIVVHKTRYAPQAVKLVEYRCSLTVPFGKGTNDDCAVLQLYRATHPDSLAE